MFLLSKQPILTCPILIGYNSKTWNRELPGKLPKYRNLFKQPHNHICSTKVPRWSRTGTPLGRARVKKRPAQQDIAGQQGQTRPLSQFFLVSPRRRLALHCPLRGLHRHRRRHQLQSQSSPLDEPSFPSLDGLWRAKKYVQLAYYLVLSKLKA